MTRPETKPNSGLFDFITHPELKANLASNYKELQGSVEQGNWTAAHVLAGSIIEAALMDYLLAVQHADEAKLLKWDLSDLIAAGKAEGVVTDRASYLCHVIKDYRNLIHPGRVLRLKEKVDEEGARVALSLVKMVAQDIGGKKAEVYGYTAEQLVTKLESDLGCVAYLPHILKDMKDGEKRRLVLSVLPERNYEWNSFSDEGCPASVRREVRSAFGKCFRVVRQQVNWETQTELIRQYVAILKEKPSHYRKCYEETFFRFTDVEHKADVFQIELIKQHLLNRLKEDYSPALLEVAMGVAKYVNCDDVKSGAARGLWSPAFFCSDEEDGEVYAKWFSQEYELLPEYTVAEFDADMEQACEHWRQLDRRDLAAAMQQLIHCRGIPF